MRSYAEVRNLAEVEGDGCPSWQESTSFRGMHAVLTVAYATDHSVHLYTPRELSLLRA